MDSKCRSKRPDASICENFILAEPDENAFASKEYLSKELLRYLLQLELLPEVQDTVEPNGSIYPETQK